MQQPNTSIRRAAPRRNAAAVWLGVLTLGCLAASGCARDLETAYGQRSGPGASLSVNGTAVLAEMFEQAGCRVHGWRSLSPRLAKEADCIVWFPDDFEPPSEEVRAWLEAWLMDRPYRTLVYVGRDFDAAPWYWEKVRPDAPAEQAEEIDRRLRRAQGVFSTQRRAMPEQADCSWFVVEGAARPRKVRSLSGEREWLDGIDADQLEIELVGRMRPGAAADVVLASDGDMLVSREPWDQSELIVVANGSFLLNLPLVNHEHRKLAGKLVAEAGGPGRSVVFLESGPGGPPILEADPAARSPSGLAILMTEPIVWVFLHFALAGVLFCFARWPTFGLPRELEAESTSDFGKHVEALGELLRRSRDRAYAMTRLLHYQQTTRDANP